MSSQTSAVHSAAAGALRRGKNEMMRQWRRRGALRLFPGAVWGLWFLAVVLDGIALAGGLLLAGADRLLPQSARNWLDTSRLDAWRPDISDVYLRNEGRAGLLCLGMVVCLMGSLNIQARYRRLSLVLYGASWFGLLTALALGAKALVGQLLDSGVDALAGVDTWLFWVGLLTLVLGMALETCTRRGWCLLATGLASGLLLLAGVAWPDEQPMRLVGEGWGACPPVVHLGMLVPGVLMLAGYGALAVGWMLGMLGLACVLARPGRVEPLGSVVHHACRCFQIGISLVAGALLLESSWGGQSAGWHLRPREVWAMAPMLVAALVLLCRFHRRLGAPALAVLIVAGFSGLVLGWVACHAQVGMIALAGWVALVNLCLAVHAAQRYLAYLGRMKDEG